MGPPARRPLAVLDDVESVLESGAGGGALGAGLARRLAVGRAVTRFLQSGRSVSGDSQSACGGCRVERVTGSDRTSRFVSGVSMLSICTAPGCTTIVFGRGTCVEHDRRQPPLTDRLLAEAVARSQTAQRPPGTLGPS